MTRPGALAALALALVACAGTGHHVAPGLRFAAEDHHARRTNIGSATVSAVSAPFAPDEHSAIAVDRTGRVWLTIRGVGIVRRSASGTWTTFRISRELRRIALDADNSAWAIGLSGYQVVRIAPDDRISVYRTPVFWYGTLLAAGGGSAWLASHASGDIVRLQTDGSMRRFPTGMKKIKALAADSRGRIWFIGENPGKRVTSAGTPLDDDYVGSLRENGAATKRRADDAAFSAAPVLAVDTSGSAWFTTCGAIDRMSAAGAIRRFALRRPSDCPSGITVDPNGIAWFSDPRRNAIGRVTQKSGAVDLYAVKTPAHVNAMGTDARGHLWIVAPSLLGTLHTTRSYAPMRRANAGPSTSL